MPKSRHRHRKAPQPAKLKRVLLRRLNPEKLGSLDYPLTHQLRLWLEQGVLKPSVHKLGDWLKLHDEAGWQEVRAVSSAYHDGHPAGEQLILLAMLLKGMESGKQEFTDEELMRAVQRLDSCIFLEQMVRLGLIEVRDTFTFSAKGDQIRHTDKFPVNADPDMLEAFLTEGNSTTGLEK